MNQSKVLVTGSTGFLGRRIVEMLIEKGFQVRALVRSASKANTFPKPETEISQGDVAVPESLNSAFEGIDYVIHAAADTSGTAQGARQVTIGGTKNILDLSATCQVKKLIYISSCSVYGPEFKNEQVIDEKTPLERFPKHRGLYSWAKLEAEKIILDAMHQEKIPVTCLRPGTIYGPGGENFSPILGFAWKKKIFAVIHKPNFILPLVYLDNLVEAIIAAMLQDKSTGQVYNVVDAEQVDKKDYMEGLIRKLYPEAWFFYVPYSLLSAAVGLQECLCRALRIEPILTKYRLISSQNAVIFDSSKIRTEVARDIKKEYR